MKGLNLNEIFEVLDSKIWNYRGSSDGRYSKIFMYIYNAYTKGETPILSDKPNYFSQDIPDLVIDLVSKYSLDQFEKEYIQMYNSKVFGLRTGNWLTLKANNLEYLFSDFDSNFRGTITKINKITVDNKTYTIISTNRDIDEGNVYFIDYKYKRLDTCCFRSELDCLMYQMFGSNMFGAVTAIYEATNKE